MEATYIRVSTIKQNTITQENKVIGQAYIDKVSGVTPFCDRVQGSLLLNDIAIGKVNHVYVSRIDRMGRCSADIMNTIEYFKSHNCQLTITTMGNLNLYEGGKVNYAFMMIISLYSQISEQQKCEIREKTQEGIEAGKKRGVFRGRQKNTGEDVGTILSKHKDIVNCLKLGMSLNKTAETTRKSKPTIIKVKKLISY
jgi:DNA invertase Pin-like site-specific DNA recombinase